MNNRERSLAILNYEDYDRLPLVHFGFWEKTLQKWAAEDHLTVEEAENWEDGNPVDAVITEKLGFDFVNETRFFLKNLVSDLEPRPEGYYGARQHPDTTHRHVEQPG